MAMADESAPSGLFAIFLLAIYSLVLIPYTLYYLCSSGEEKAQVVKGKKKGSSWQKLLDKLLTKGNLALLAAWVGWAVLLLYVQSSAGEASPFDPFEILGVARGATEKEVKKAYRKLSLQYHPDKNPDPKAASYFASHISKAYAALTDEVSRQNYEKYGHPDGPQGTNIGIALPSWMFNKDRKTAPLLLLGLVGGCILLPLAIVSYYMLKGDNYSGPNRIHNATLYTYAATKYGIKESQSLVRIPETLMCAMEFIQLYTPNDHTLPMDELRRMVAPSYPDLMGRDKKAFWTRRGSVIKAHMLLLAHLERMGDDVPAALQADLKFIRQKCPLLLEEMVKIACLPRNNLGWGWMTPALASVEMMQCIAQGVPISARKGGAKGGDTVAALLALPHFDQDTVKRLRKQRIGSVRELQALPEAGLLQALSSAGVAGDAADEVAAALAAVPQLAADVEFEVDGEDEVCERDPVHCKVRVLLSRQSHAAPGFKLRGTAVRAFTPSNPEPQDEAWYVFLVDSANNHVVSWTKANLIEAEREGLEHPEAFADLLANEDVVSAASSKAAAAAAAAKAAEAAKATNGKAPAAAAAAEGGGESGGAKGKKEEEKPGQVLDLVFMAPPQGRYDFTLHIMSSTWVGADLSIPARLRVFPLTRAQAEGRDPKSLERRRFASDSDSDREERASGVGGGSSGSGSDSEDDEGTGDYDSEETGEEVSSEGEDEPAAGRKGGKSGKSGGGGGGQEEEESDELPELVDEEPGPQAKKDQ